MGERLIAGHVRLWFAAGLTVVLAARADGAPAPAREGWRPVHRFVEDAARQQSLREPPATAVGETTRYVLLAPSETTIDRTHGDPHEVPKSGELEVTVTCPAALAGRCTVASVSVGTGGGVADGAVCCPAEPGKVSFRVGRLPPGPALPPLTHLRESSVGRWDSPAVDVPEGATLELALGIADPGARREATPAAFTVTAVADTGPGVELLQRTLDPAERPADAGWVEVRVPLATARQRLGGRLRLTFETRAAASGRKRPALPVWGDPTLTIGAGPSARPARNVILVSLDTLRADRLGCYGAKRPTPTLDRLAREGTLFLHGMAPATWTLPSHASLMTATYPCVHGRTVWDPARLALPPGVVPLAEVLRGVGYRTVAFTGDGLVDPGTFQRGFESFQALTASSKSATPRRLERTLGDAEAWLRAHHTEPFFLFLHTYEVHRPYQPPEPYRTTVLRTAAKDATDVDLRGKLASVLYDGEVLYLDARLRGLFALVESLGLGRRTVIIVTSDHGESFGEHHAWEHGTSLFQQQVHVPLVFWGPGVIPAGRRIAKPAGLVDVMPTVLELLGLPRPQAVQGRSLVPFLGREPPRQPPEWSLYAELREQLAIRYSVWKGFFEQAKFQGAFRIDQDPGETKRLRGGNLASGFSAQRQTFLDECARLRRVLQIVPEAGAGAPRAVDPERERMLRELGYVQ